MKISFSTNLMYNLYTYTIFMKQFDSFNKNKRRNRPGSNKNKLMNLALTAAVQVNHY